MCEKPSISRYRAGCKCHDCKEIGRKSNSERDRKIPRLPVEPLVSKFTDQDFLKKYGSSLKAWETSGVHVFKVDEICCSMGFHPYEIYGEDWFLITLRGSKEE